MRLSERSSVVPADAALLGGDALLGATIAVGWRPGGDWVSAGTMSVGILVPKASSSAGLDLGATAEYFLGADSKSSTFRGVLKGAEIVRVRS